MTELLRFFSVAALGVVLDIAVALTLHEALGVSLWIAAAIGFTVAAGTNYALHQTWSFRRGSRRLSARRAWKYAAVAILTLLARIGIVALLDRLLDDDLALFILLCGAGVSFCVNFALSKFFVFAEASVTPDAS